jgi:hypothetical protein
MSFREAINAPQEQIGAPRITAPFDFYRVLAQGIGLST